MKCAIEECVNNDKDQPKNADIKYHKFPKDPDLCNAWLESLHMAKFAAYYRRLICSNHFKEEDYYETKQGKRQLRPGAIPYLEDCYGPAALRTCKICLTMDAKMYQLKNGLEKMYKDVMGIEPRADHLNRLPMAICWECTARLNSAASFKSKALYCDELLHKHLLDNADLKILHIQKIHQGQTHLQSSLTVQQVFKFNNLDDEDDAPNTCIKAETIDIPNNEEIEVELESLLTDNITVKDERNNSIILVSNVPETEGKIENDLADPISDVEDGDETNFVDNYDDVDYDKLTENIYIVDNLDSRNVSNTNLDSANASTNEVNMETDNDAMYISQITDTNNEETVINLTSDEEKSGAEGIPIQVRAETVMPVKKKKKIIDDDVIIWVKGRRPRKKSTYVPPCKPIDENIFSMIPLDPEDLRKEILARRDSDHYKNSPFKCEICYKGFPTEEKRDIHVLKHSEKNGPFKCNICFVHVRRNRELNAHFSRQHMTEFICKLCPLKTRNREVALGHMKYHNGSMYNCPQCSLEFKKKTTLLNHLRLRHMSSFVCELCGYTFVSKHGVAAHKGLKHKLVDPDAEFTGPYCEECGVKFLTDKAYNRHLRLSSKHIAEDDPNRMSNDPSSKERRLGNSNIKSARRPSGRHRKTNNATTSDGQNTTSLSRQKIFQCDHCKKKFKIKQDLVGHMREHDDTRLNFTCEICGNQFTYSYNLTRHMFLHTGLKPFKCDVCEKTFSTSCELKAHVDYVHLKIPRPKRVRRKANKCEVQKLDN